MRTPGKSWTEEAAAELIEEQKQLQPVPTDQLILMALASIMDQQYQGADNRFGRPPLSDTALRWTIRERADG